MVSRYERPATVSKGRAAGWTLAVMSLFWPRLFLVLFWIFDDELLRRAFDSWLVPFVGFFVLPWTTIAYAAMWGASSDSVHGVEWVVVGIAFLLDFWTYAGIRRLWSS